MNTKIMSDKIIMKMTTIIRIVSVLGLLIGLSYFPESPIYLLGTLQEAEIGIWAIFTIIISVLLLVLSFTSHKRNKLLNNIGLAFLFLLNFMALLIYILFKIGTPIEETPFNQATVPILGLIAHGVMLLVIIVSGYFAFKEKIDT